MTFDIVPYRTTAATKPHVCNSFPKRLQQQFIHHINPQGSRKIRSGEPLTAKHRLSSTPEKHHMQMIPMGIRMVSSIAAKVSNVAINQTRNNKEEKEERKEAKLTIPSSRPPLHSPSILPPTSPTPPRSPRSGSYNPLFRSS